MQRDLLGAQAAINWTVAKLPAFERKLDGWVKRNVHVVWRDTDPPTDNYVVLSKERRLLPLRYSVEAGAYLNTIRSSLDVLASALSARNGKTGNVEAHFPIYRSDLHMLDPLNGLESEKWLTDAQRTVIKLLEPYPGGNDALVALHQLDIMRKHRRLLETRTLPSMIRILGIRREHVVFPGRMGVGANGETVLAFVSKHAPQGQINPTMFVGFGEAGRYGDLPVVPALREFARVAADIIAKFDLV